MANRGRPSGYSETIADEICEHLANGKSLLSWCNEEGNPTRATVFRWVAKYPEFRDKYARAREEQADAFADEIAFIADTEEDANKARVRIDARKWVAARMQPRKYGERVATEIFGKDGGPIVTETSEVEQARRVAYMLGLAMGRLNVNATQLPKT